MIRWCDAFSWGEYRAGWREFLPELFAEDQMIHWFDLMRNITQMDIVQVNANSYLPNWSDLARSIFHYCPSCFSEKGRL